MYLISKAPEPLIFFKEDFHLKWLFQPFKDPCFSVQSAAALIKKELRDFASTMAAG